MSDSNNNMSETDKFFSRLSAVIATLVGGWIILFVLIWAGVIAYYWIYDPNNPNHVDCKKHPYDCMVH